MNSRIILIYDIESDRIRSKIADACLDYGLDRVQFSAFMGKLSRNYQEELMRRLGDLLGDERGNVKLIPISHKDWSDHLEIEQ